MYRPEEIPSFLTDLQQKVVNELKTTILFHGANELASQMKKRIFTQGKDANGSIIQSKYSETPTYVNKDVFVRKGAFTPKGKENKGNFKNGKERKTMYLPQGYKELRDIQGRQTSFVDWRYSGSLEKSIETMKNNNDVVIAIVDNEESIKRKAIEERTGKDIFTPSVSELEYYENVIAKEIENLSI